MLDKFLLVQVYLPASSRVTWRTCHLPPWPKWERLLRKIFLPLTTWCRCRITTHRTLEHCTLIFLWPFGVYLSTGWPSYTRDSFDSRFPNRVWWSSIALFSTRPRLYCDKTWYFLSHVSSRSSSPMGYFGILAFPAVLAYILVLLLNRMIVGTASLKSCLSRFWLSPWEFDWVWI